MIEIFIPTLIKNQELQINKISDNFLNAIKIFDLKIETFESTFFSGIKIKSKIIDKDLIILSNGEFGNNYFIDYDILENKNIITSGIKIIGQNQIGENIQKLCLI
ncbi:MAG: hypothetical protein Q9M97_01155 [Candidatus Gracilibacteria bacterium]|nr:hypothetical protein [Candidatus Gracilibacteria bacterium]